MYLKISNELLPKSHKFNSKKASYFKYTMLFDNLNIVCIFYFESIKITPLFLLTVMSFFIVFLD